MPKRRGPSLDVERAHKKLSLTALAAKASSSSLRYEQHGSFLNILTSSTRLKRHSSVNLRSADRPVLRPSPLQPGLALSGHNLQTHPDHDVASIKELLIFPTSLAMIKPNWIFRYHVNCTPQLGPELPQHIECMLYQKYMGCRTLPRPERLPYLHLGSTALGFRLNFYLVLPCATPSHGPTGSGNMCYNDLQAVYDVCIRPALETAFPRRQRWASWSDAKNESHVKPLMSRRRSMVSQLQEERMHCEGLQTLWDAIDIFSEHPQVADIMRGKQLVAHGDVEVHDWQSDWKPTWAQFTQLWNDGVNTNHVGPDTKFTMEMTLGFDDLDCLKDFPAIPTRPERPSVRSPTPDNHFRPMTPGPRSGTPVSEVYSPPPSAPPQIPLPAVPTTSDAISVPKRASRRVSSRHSIRCVDSTLPDLFELSEMD